MKQVFLGVMTSKNLHIRRSTRIICKNEQNLSLAKIIRSPFFHDRWAKFFIEKKKGPTFVASSLFLFLD